MEGKGSFIVVTVIFLGLSLLTASCGRIVAKESAAEIKDLEKNIVKVDDMKVLPENEGKLVVVGGMAKRDSIVLDDEFDMSKETILLYRKVEMYQWREVVDGDDYKYTKDWYERLIDDSTFEHKNGFLKESHENPNKKPYESKNFFNEVILGDFKLTNEQISKIKPTIVIEELSSEVADEFDMIIEDHYYTTVKEGNPKIGDVRISFFIVDPSKYKNITILAKQIGNTFEEFRVDNGTPAGRMTNDIFDGVLSPAEVIASRENEGDSYSMFFYILAIILLIPIALAARNTFKKKNSY